jgi:hypothetical protein
MLEEEVQIPSRVSGLSFQLFYRHPSVGQLQSRNTKINNAVVALIPAREPDQLILNKIYLLTYSFQVAKGFPGIPTPPAEKHFRFKHLVRRFLHRYPKQRKGTVRRKLDPDEAGFSCAGMDHSRRVSIPNEI